MWQVTKHIFLGEDRDARDIGRIRSAGITHIVNCAEELPCYHSDIFIYLPLYLSDPDSYFQMRLPALCKFIHDAQKKGNVLIHCNGGISRSPACVLAYLCHCGHSLAEAAVTLQKKVQTRPDTVFLMQIADYFDFDLSEKQGYEILAILGG